MNKYRRLCDINFYIIRGLSTNFAPSEDYLSSAKRIFTFTPKHKTQQQVTAIPSPSPLTFSNLSFISEVGVALMRATTLNFALLFPNFTLLNSLYSLSSLTLNTSVLFISHLTQPTIQNYLTIMLQKWNTFFLTILSLITISGYLNVHHLFCLSSHFTDPHGEYAFNFSILNDLEQLVQHPTLFTDRLEDHSNIQN